MKRITFAAVALLASACAKNDQANTDSAALTDSAAATAATPSTSSPDQEFLTKMIDHHEGMIQMAEAAMTKASKPATQTDAHNVHVKQMAERDSMKAMLSGSFSATHTPTHMPEHMAMMDSLTAKTGAAYDRAFYQNTVRHHMDGIRMIDQYLTQLANPQVRAMAEKMKADQQKEIEAFQPKSKS